MYMFYVINREIFNLNSTLLVILVTYLKVLENNQTKGPKQDG